MKGKHLSSVLILIAALGVAVFVVQDHRSDSSANDPLDTYLEKEGIERVNEGEEPNLDAIHQYEETDEVGVRPGTMLKDLVLPVWKDESEMSISDFQGDFLILNMWATWCPPCRDEMPDLVQFHEDYQEEGVQVAGINMTTQERSEEEIGRFIEEFDIPFPTMMDPDGEVAVNYQVIAMPTTFILDPDGRVVVRRQGYINYEMLEEYVEEAKKRYEEAGE
ncbi:TlpA disulfide reductase family protein [Alteribacter populi]|uniref:TlpA disulfide reductase family protein n=1 Tax=Alteribacter populi TaxID=2011011 RepID=UPI000BBAD93B|nr:TlpA disulfide reductase family protein [Alteribacter populi]